MGETSERKAGGIVRQESQKHVVCFRRDSLESRKRQVHGGESLVEVVRSLRGEIRIVQRFDLFGADVDDA